MERTQLRIVVSGLIATRVGAIYQPFAGFFFR